MSTGLNDAFKIEWEWQAAPSVRSPEHRATWARIEITVGSEHVTLVEDRDSSSSRRSIYCPLYPLAEWISHNWWLLQANSRPAVPLELLPGGFDQWMSPENEGMRRHCMRSASDGFLWPNLTIIPQGLETLIRWSADRVSDPSRRVRYLSQGYSFVDSVIVNHVLSGLVESVIARLGDQGVADVPLFDEWNAIQQADSEEIQFCLAAARLGLDPYAEADTVEMALVRAGNELDGALLDDFLNAVDPQRLDAGLDWVSGARHAVEESAGGQDTLLTVRDAIRVDSSYLPERPWQMGWQQARRVRTELGLDPDARIDLGQYLTSISRPSGDRRLQAVGGAGRDHRSPTVIIGGSNSDKTRRFTLSRALWHFLVDVDPSLSYYWILY